MRFGWVTLNVKDMPASLDFYTKVVGLRINRQIKPMPGTEIAFLGDGESGTELELIANGKNTNPQYGADVFIGFEVPSLEECMGQLAEKKIPFRGPFQPGPMIKFVYVEDPNGAQIQFFENLMRA